MRVRLLTAAIAVLISVLPASAQFYSQGTEPAGLRWRQIRTEDYRVIFPAGIDSLARVYAEALERVKFPVGATAGFIPNQEYKNPFPVILHPYSAVSNGMVVWSPRRMELLTTPMTNNAVPTPWPEHLAVHESRHVAQMQFVNHPRYRPFRWFLGDIFAAAASSLYPESSFYEGDAVAAETELTPSGRGRVGSFLEYYRAAFREGDKRDFWKWRYGSLTNYTPDYYTVGYIRAAGMRSVYGAQDFTARYYANIFRNRWWSFPMFVYPRTVKEVSGKSFNDAFSEICDTLSARWLRDEVARAPFMDSEAVTGEEKLFPSYSSLCMLDGELLAIRSSLSRAPELVRVGEDGTPRRLSRFAYSTSRLKAGADGRVYWSEIVADPRWEQRSWSEIFCAGPDGRHRRLSSRTRWFNPSPSPDGSRIAVTEYPVEGGSALVVFDPSGEEEAVRYEAPDGLQIIESAWLGKELVVNAIGPEGSGIYSVTGGWTRMLDAGHAVIKELFTHEGRLHFTSDLGGVSELYVLDGGEPRRLTNFPQGATSFVYSEKGDTLMFVTLNDSGRRVRKAPVSALRERPADFGKPHRYEFAEDLEAPLPIDRNSVVTVPEPEPYNRLLNAFRFHSWAPVYVNYDAIQDLSFDSITSSLGLGATAFFQNHLNTFYGSAAYRASYEDKKWVHGGEFKFTYSGLYPKLEATLSVDSSPAQYYFLNSTYRSFAHIVEVGHEEIEGRPYVNASLLAYVPLSFSSGGWYRGVVPQLRAVVSNSVFSRGSITPMNRVIASLRAYAVTATPASALYPRLGGGVEAGISGRVGTTEVFAPNAYFYTYGYFPGFADLHGVRLSATLQMPVGESVFNERYVSVMPRGMSSSSTLASRLAYSAVQSRLTADYAFPFATLDWSGLGPVAYVRNLECTLHGDCSVFAGGTPGTTVLGSVGTDLCVVLGNLLWLTFDTRIGVSAYYNIGVPEGMDRFNVGLVFNMDI